ncbi:gonadotropin subunit beta-1-like [Alosa pseudoharengus]|uniref:gonadotropin subunit beta-1-like n=1 Tax=Alosa pseudoharengus TaxID=34774 RepID=UPI003F8A4A34
MHVVTMVALWSLVQAVVPECQLVNISIPVEMENGRCCYMETQGCAGLCSNTAPVYRSPSGKQNAEVSCHFQEWTYETRRVPEQCYSGSELLLLTVPKALSCKCSTCNTNHYDCSPLSPEQVCRPSEPPLLPHHL